MKVTLTVSAMIVCTIAANLMLKLGATYAASRPELAAAMNWRVLVGLGSFGAAGLLYSVVLRWLPLNVAQSLAALQFVGVILASAWVLSEPINRGQWAGIALITCGIIAVSLSTR